MSTPNLRAVLVTDGRSGHLGTVLASFAAVDDVLPVLEIISVGDAEIAVPVNLAVRITRSIQPTYAAALNEAIAAQPARDDELIWLLHDDTAPDKGALARLVATAAKRPRAAVVAPAHVRWRDTSRLVSMGTTVSRVGARRIPLVVEDDIDQGQHDWREDVMAVSLGGALVRRSAWDSLGGLDEGYGGFGESLEFCRRAWAAGWDVVLAPQVRVRHAQESLYGLRARGKGRVSTHAVRRTSEWHHAFAWAPWWMVPILAVLIPLSVVSRVGIRLAQNSPRTALAEVQVLPLLAARIPAVFASTRAHRRVGATGPIEARLFAKPAQVVDAVRQRELGTFERARAERIPSEMVRAELERARARHRLSFLIAVLTGLVTSAVLASRWMSDVLAGRMLVAPGTGVTDISRSDVWNAAWSGWNEIGFGVPAIDGAYAGLMLPAAIAPGGTRLGIAVLLATAPLMALLIGWWAAGHATRAPWVRLAAAIVWGLWPPFLAAVLDARIGPVIAHVMLGCTAVAVARAAGWRRGELIGGREERPAPGPSPSAALAGSLALTAATVAQPVLLLPTLGVVIALATRAGAQRWRIMSMAAVPLVVGLPGLVAGVRHAAHPGVALSILAREPGPGESVTGGVWRTALGIADPERWPSSLENAWPLGAAAAAIVLVCALLALASRRASQPAAWGVALLGVGLIVAAWSAHATAAWSDGAGHDAISGWPGTGASLVALGALVAGLSAHGNVLKGEGRRFAAGRTFAAGAATLAAGSTLAVVVLLALPDAPRGGVTTADAGVLPLAVPLDQQGTQHQRVLVLTENADGSIGYDVLAHDGATLVLGRAQRGPDGTPLSGGGNSADIADISQTVAAAAVSPAADLNALRDWGIGTIVVAPGAEGAQSALSQNPQVSLASGSERGQTYRLADGAVSRAWIEAADGERVIVPATATDGETLSPPPGGGTLVIAVPYSAGWSAHADGAALERSDDTWGRAVFDVPAGAGKVTFSYRDPIHRWWWWASAIALTWALIGSIPLRRSREVTP